MPYSILSQRGLIRLSGEESLSFLQGLVSNDVTPLTQGRAIYAALLSPQGKFLYDFFLLPWRGAIFIDCDRERMAALAQAMNLYRLRSKVIIDVMSGLVVALWGEGGEFPAGQEAQIFADPRLPALGGRAIGEAAAIDTLCREHKINKTGEDAYERLRLEAGVPDGRDMITNKSLLLEFGFEDLHGVDFHKGCYVGQEVTARSKHRGQLRRFIYQVRADGDLPEPGTAIYRDDIPVGELRSASGPIGLALLNVAGVEKAQTAATALHCGNVTLKAALPQWVTHIPKALENQE